MYTSVQWTMGSFSGGVNVYHDTGTLSQKLCLQALVQYTAKKAVSKQSQTLIINNNLDAV